MYEFKYNMIKPCELIPTDGIFGEKNAGARSPNFWNHQLYQFDVSAMNSDPMGWPQKKGHKKNQESGENNKWLFQCKAYWTFPYALYLQGLVISRKEPTYRGENPTTPPCTSSHLHQSFSHASGKLLCVTMVGLRSFHHTYSIGDWSIEEPLTKGKKVREK